LYRRGALRGNCAEIAPVTKKAKVWDLRLLEPLLNGRAPR